MKRRLRDVRRIAGPLGFALEGLSGGNHLRLLHPDGTQIFASLSPSDVHADPKLLVDLRRALREAAA